MSKVLVTGGTGYIGSVLVRDLVQRGYSTRIFDKLYFGKEHLGDLVKRVEVIQGDLRDFDKGVADRVLEGVSSVIHLAGFSNDPMADYSPEANMAVNTEGTRILAEACAERGTKKFIFGSSASIYDRGTRSSEEIQDENSPVEPKAAYSISKFEAEKALLKIMEAHPDFCPVILRKGTIFGYSPRMRFDLVVNTFVKEAFLKGKLNVFCGGTQWRPLIDVTDVASAYSTCLEADADKVRGEIFNVVQGNYQVWDVAHRIKSALVENKLLPNLDVNIDYKDDRIDRSYQISGRKLEDRLGFRYKGTIEEAAFDIGERISKGQIPVETLRDPKYYNIAWMEKLSWWEKTLKEIGKVGF